jgi:peptidylprolyl isomerase
VLAASAPADWRTPDPEHTLYLELPSGRVVLELAPQLAPLHAENVRVLAREGFFDGLAVVRVHENYVTQWGDPDGKKEVREGKKALAPEFTLTGARARSLAFRPLPDPDTFAPEAGFVAGFPVARDRKRQEAWSVHCYSMVGAGRENGADTGSGAELYAVIGHAPRHLDRNMTVVGRILRGMEHLTALPRGSGPLGFYEKPEQRVPVLRARLAADVPVPEREPLEVLRTDTPRFGAWVQARRNRQDAFFVRPAGRLDVCNALPPVRTPPAPAP